MAQEATSDIKHSGSTQSAAEAGDGAERHQPSSPARTRHYLPPHSRTPPPFDAPAGVAATHRPPHDRSKLRRRLRIRWWTREFALRRQLLRAPYTSSLRPTYARAALCVPRTALRAGQLGSKPSLPPRGRGDAAPSSRSPRSFRHSSELRTRNCRNSAGRDSILGPGQALNAFILLHLGYASVPMSCIGILYYKCILYSSIIL